MSESVDKILPCDYHIEQHFPLVLFFLHNFVSWRKVSCRRAYCCVSGLGHAVLLYWLHPLYALCLRNVSQRWYKHILSWKRNIFNICLSFILVLGACFHLAYDISCSFCLGNAGAGDRSEPTGQIPLKVSQESWQSTPGFFMRRHVFRRV